MPGDIVAWTEDFVLLDVPARFERHDAPVVRWIASLTVEPKADKGRVK